MRVIGVFPWSARRMPSVGKTYGTGVRRCHLSSTFPGRAGRVVRGDDVIETGLAGHRRVAAHGDESRRRGARVSVAVGVAAHAEAVDANRHRVCVGVVLKELLDVDENETKVDCSGILCEEDDGEPANGSNKSSLFPLKCPGELVWLFGLS